MTKTKLRIRLIIDDEVDISYYSYINGDSINALKQTKKVIDSLTSISFDEYNNDFLKAIKIFESLGANLIEKDVSYLKKYFKDEITKVLTHCEYNLKNGVIITRDFNNINYPNTFYPDSNVTIWYNDNKLDIDLDIFPRVPIHLNNKLNKYDTFIDGSLAGILHTPRAIREYHFNVIYNTFINSNRVWLFFFTDDVNENATYYYINDGYTDIEDILK